MVVYYERGKASFYDTVVRFSIENYELAMHDSVILVFLLISSINGIECCFFLVRYKCGLMKLQIINCVRAGISSCPIMRTIICNFAYLSLRTNEA